MGGLPEYGDIHSGEALAGDINASETEEIVFTLILRLVCREHMWNAKIMEAHTVVVVVVISQRSHDPQAMFSRLIYCPINGIKSF